MTDVPAAPDGPSDDRELRDDKGQTCTTCDEHFKYQHLYDDHLPCRARSFDPTIASIEAQNTERDRLRFENARLGAALTAALVDVETLRAECARLSAAHAQAFRNGYDRAVYEIRDHFAKVQNGDVVAVVEEIWTKKQEKA